MNAEQLKALQTPLKSKYRDEPAAALLTLKIEGRLADDAIACNVASPRGNIHAGLHPAAGGDGSLACSGDMLLEALVGCAGVTLKAVATAMAVPLRGAVIRAEGDLDFRGTLGVSKEVPIGFKEIRLTFELDTDAPQDQIDTLIKLAKRYCVIWQTLSQPAKLESIVVRK
jgi:uncharacterized OsmC-like protein